ncbi:hypothetical protein [Parapedobacter koreensis]|uniref:hypothetical protein n=1 Tax=Parapedobacter koreensis TaxID=332977 RepID=UPI000B8191A3|nr:hypothetical protein [Parapedobacter koreensis]
MRKLADVDTNAVGGAASHRGFRKPEKQSRTNLKHLSIMEASLNEAYELLFPILDEDDKCEHIYL